MITDINTITGGWGQTHQRATRFPSSRCHVQAAPAALLRAARRAREIARQIGAAVVIVRDGTEIVSCIEEDKRDLAD